MAARSDGKRSAISSKHLQIGSYVAFKSTQRKPLDIDRSAVTNICTRGNEFIVKFTNKWWFQVCTLESETSKLQLNADLISKIRNNELVTESQTRKLFGVRCT